MNYFSILSANFTRSVYADFRCCCIMLEYGVTSFVIYWHVCLFGLDTLAQKAQASKRIRLNMNVQISLN